ncbi:bacteriocin [Chryseobacterium sp. G0186]|uniref:bacteriocin n=1 Tax=Chryseobacterium sp. G0186 TaxID=2487064 RepID=UPI0016262D60|nr:bacteriocin [Chryseobacterium sp. G0186]
MKKQNLNKGKKLSKKELKTIAGGKLICTHSGGGCAQISPTCYEPQCRPGITMVCMPGTGPQVCTTISMNCEEPPCRPKLDIPIAE